MVGMQPGRRRLVWRTALRGLLSITLLAGAVASLIYGAKYHFVTVFQEEETEISITLQPPPPLGMPGELPFGTPGARSPFDEMPPPGMEQPFDEPESADPAAPYVEPPPPELAPPLQSIKQKVIVTEEKDESELTLIREVTFGGIALRDSELWRTYTGQPPSMCPT